MSDPGAPMPADDAGADMPAAGDDAPASKVLCTVMDNGDGSFSLTEGDEPDAGDTAVPTDGGDPAAPAAQTYDSVGALLKAVLDCVKKAQDGGEGGEQAFTAGFDGGSNASPAKAPPAAPPKY